MSDNDIEALISILARNRLMRSQAEIAAWDEALTHVAAHPQREAFMGDLHLLFDDSCADPEVMFRLVHLLESFDETKQFLTLIDLAPQLMEQAPWWMEVLHCRILNNPAARKHFGDLLQSSTSPGTRAVRAVLDRIRDTRPPPLSELAQFVRDV